MFTNPEVLFVRFCRFSFWFWFWSWMTSYNVNTRYKAVGQLAMNRKPCSYFFVHATCLEWMDTRDVPLFCTSVAALLMVSISYVRLSLLTRSDVSIYVRLTVPEGTFGCFGTFTLETGHEGTFRCLRYPFVRDCPCRHALGTRPSLGPLL